MCECVLVRVLLSNFAATNTNKMNLLDLNDVPKKYVCIEARGEDIICQYKRWIYQKKKKIWKDCVHFAASAVSLSTILIIKLQNTLKIY